jgi:hypothetical protein
MTLSLFSSEQTFFFFFGKQEFITNFGASPLSGCSFDFSSVLVDVKTMVETARLVENVGVGAYLGAAHLVQDQTFLTAAASIVTIEARHQTILNMFEGAVSVPQPFDIPLAPQEVLAMVGSFISGCSLGVTGALFSHFPHLLSSNGVVR